MIFDVVTLTSTPSITNFLVFFSVLLEKFWEKNKENTNQSGRDLNKQCMHIFSFAIQGAATPEIFYNHLCKGNWNKHCTNWAHTNQEEGDSEPFWYDAKD